MRKETERGLEGEASKKEKKKKKEGGQVGVFFFSFLSLGNWRWQWGQVKKMDMRLEYFWQESLASLKNLF